MENHNIDNVTTPNLPSHILEAQTFMARVFADGAKVENVDLFIKAWLNGYYAAYKEIGAIDDDDTDGEIEMLKKLRD